MKRRRKDEKLWNWRAAEGKEPFSRVWRESFRVKFTGLHTNSNGAGQSLGIDEEEVRLGGESGTLMGPTST